MELHIDRLSKHYKNKIAVDLSLSLSEEESTDCWAPTEPEKRLSCA